MNVQHDVRKLGRTAPDRHVRTGGRASGDHGGDGGGDGTVGKALDVLDRVASHGAPVRFAELLDGSPYPKATLYRLLQTLAKQGMLAQDSATGAYRPGLRLVRMAHAAWRTSSLAPVARPHLEALGRDVGHTVHLAQLDGGVVLYVDKVGGAAAVPMYSEAGKVGPAFCTGVGKAMLAWLPEDALRAALARQAWQAFTPTTLASEAALRADLRETRARGHALDRSEHEQGIVCVAMPVLTGGGHVAGAVSITDHVERTSLAALERKVPRLRAAVDAITGAIQDWRFPDRIENGLQDRQED